MTQLNLPYERQLFEKGNIVCLCLVSFLWCTKVDLFSIWPTASRPKALQEHVTEIVPTEGELVWFKA